MIDKPMAPPQPVSPLSSANPLDAADLEIEIEADPGTDPADAIGQAMDILSELTEPAFDANLAETLEDSFLASLSSDLTEDYGNDRASRSDWEKTIEDGLDLLGLKMEDRAEPWNGACGVYHPLLTEAAIRFQSEMISETFPAMGPVKAKIVGATTPEIEEAAQRVVDDMNYHLTEKMTEFRPEHERMLWSESLFGSAFKKVYYDDSLGRPTSVFVPAEDIVVPYGASDLMTSPRITHVMRKTKNEIRKLQVAGFYKDISLGEPSKSVSPVKKRIDSAEGLSPVNDDRYTLLEMHTYLVIEDDSYGEAENDIAVPYIVTMLESSGDILSIRRNWAEDDKKKKPLQHIVHYTYIPGFGFYGFGLIHLLGNFASASTSILRQLVDAGTLSNLPGGLKTNGLRVKGDDTPIMPGEWRDVDIASGTLRDNLMPLPYKEPSQTLAALLQEVVEEGRRLAATADVKISDMNGEAPVGTTLAILERTLKVMSAIQARNHVSMSQEFKLIADLIKEYTAPYYSYPTETTGVPTYAAKRSDYEQTDIVPVSDPNSSTMAQRIIQYQSAIQLSQMAPQIYNLPILHKQMLRVMGIKDVDKIIETEDALKPTDPVSENMEVIKGKPAKAFIEQNHEAHIAVHQAFINDPNTAQMMQNNPQAQSVMQAFQAHLMEHYGFQYRQQIEQQLGMPLPPPGEKLPPEMEQQVGPLLAQAASQVSQAHAAQAQQAAAQQQQQDPLFQQAQQELQIKAQEVQNKMQIEQAKIQAQIEIARMNNEAKFGLQAAKDDSVHQLKAAEIIDRKMNPPPPPAPGKFPGSKK